MGKTNLSDSRDITISFNLSDVDDLLAFFKEKRKAIISEYEGRLSTIDKRILEIEGQKAGITQTQYKLPLEAYDHEWNWPEKTEFALKKLGKCSTVRDIFNVLSEHEPHFKKDKKTEYRFYTNLSASITYKAKDTTFIKRYKIDDASENLIGLADWFDGDKPKPEYRSENE